MPQSAIPNILTLVTFLPLIGAIVVMCLPRPKDLPDDHGGHGDGHGDPHAESAHKEEIPDDPWRLLVNWTALGFAALTFIVSLVLFFAFDSNHLDFANRHMQFMEDANWITLGTIHIHYKMGIDGISLLLILLTTFLMTLCVIYSFNTKVRLKEFMVFLLLLETGMVGVFCALDLVLFYFFWEAMLIPMYFLIGIFGHENRVYAAIKFFIYTFAGSVLMLIAIISVYNVTHSFDVLALSDPGNPAGQALHNYDGQALLWMFGAFSLAFMIKVPMFPFHTWLPDAHVEAPTAGSVILAGVMLKMGTYGFLRFCLPLFPAQAQQMAWLFILLSLIGIVYGSIVAAVQPDAKKLVAYSSVAHLGFVVLGIFTFTRIGTMGALVQNINHGISTPMLFFLVGMLYDRRHTRQISEFGGLKKIVPMLAAMLLIATLASVAVPFFNGFVGEFPILLGSWIANYTAPFSPENISSFWPTAIAASGMILSAVYMLWWFQRLMLGPVTKAENRRLPDLKTTEWLVLVPLAGVIFWFGLGSSFWTQRMDTSVAMLLQMDSGKDPAHLKPGDTDLATKAPYDQQGRLLEDVNLNLPVAGLLYQERMDEDKENAGERLRFKGHEGVEKSLQPLAPPDPSRRRPPSNNAPLQTQPPMRGPGGGGATPPAPPDSSGSNETTPPGGAAPPTSGGPTGAPAPVTGGTGNPASSGTTGSGASGAGAPGTQPAPATPANPTIPTPATPPGSPGTPPTKPGERIHLPEGRAPRSNRAASRGGEGRGNL
ncbi:MAG TPA: NADH-quinone oxidoreductase subunit M [Chthonomonadaceae bacterium]|nr:NADH-quinone oxidoreductase subunit M [Chthonomonadaceae bacterium]